jgi:hypothetical protein
MKKITTKSSSSTKLKDLAVRKKKVELSDKVLEAKSYENYVVDEILKPRSERKSRRDIIYDLVNIFHLSRPQAYHIYDRVVSEFNPQLLYTPEELQDYLLQEYMTLIDSEYSKIEPDGRAIAAALNGLQKLKENWINPAPKEEEMAIPILTSNPEALPNYKKTVDEKVAKFLSQMVKKKVQLSPVLQKLAESVNYTENDSN